ncbi:reverse transcriptase [Gossypium australe]|uniref:Reverse transcriptase n=1 Tax=Gossypium australe TaxID=47621 RepID=A0A5B6WGT9_9ROSI|nr:reverse transcriptase [Gossypium australe]
MGFEMEWMDLIMKCIFSVLYSMCFNGEMGEKFKLTRSLKQGDRLRVVDIDVDGEKGEENKGCKDDCILFGEATEMGANEMKRILQKYEEYSGKSINLEKSALFFSSNSSAKVNDSIAQLLKSILVAEAKKKKGISLV